MAVTNFFNSLGTIFSGLLGGDTRKQNNAVIVPPNQVFTGEFPKIVPKEIFYEKYHSWPQIKSSVNSAVKKIIGSDIEVTSQDEEFTEFLQEWCRITSFKKKLKLFVMDTIITGDGFLENQFTDNLELGNIEQIPTKTFFKIHRDIHGQVLKYTQNVDGILNDLDPEYIIHWAINNPDNEAFGKSEFYSVAAPRPLVGKTDPTTGEEINPTRFVAPVLDMQARNLHAEMEFKEKMAKGRIIIKAKDIPEEQLKQLKTEMNDPSSEKTFWAFNVQDKEDITVEEASISSSSKLDRYTDNMNREVDLATDVSSKISTDPGSFSFASSQTPLQEQAELTASRQAEIKELIEERIFRVLADQAGKDFDEVKPELVFKPFIKKVDLEQLNNIDPNRISDQEYRDAIRDVITLNDEEFEKQKEEKKQFAQKIQSSQKDEMQPQEIESQRPTTELLRNPKLFDNYVKTLVSNEVNAVTGTGAGGGVEPLDNKNTNANLLSLQKLETDPPAITDDEIKKKLDDEESNEKKSYEGKFAGFDTLDQCIIANTGIEDDPRGYCLSHRETKED